ncbi:MAG TPA: ABC transporter ATP-binding protein [Rhizomicrobium sp.]|jgi:branched-chain amino acid transport system ATP-binding protein|nr:ABC transporter ATP-binding protein [Rhizomicrobium sp.]
MPLLEVTDLKSYYGDFQALFGITLSVAESQTIAIIGANGAGKTTFLNSVIGLNSEKSGAILFDGEDITHVRADRISRRGIAMVPEGRRLFPSLTVEENLLAGTTTRRSGLWTLERVFALFPALPAMRDRLAMRLSGGEQQMVAVGRALLANPRLLLCDEISLGLAPKIVDQIYTCFDQIRATGISIILVEQDIARARVSADHVYCFLEGRISLQGASGSLDLRDISRAYFGT